MSVMAFDDRQAAAAASRTAPARAERDRFYAPDVAAAPGVGGFAPGQNVEVVETYQANGFVFERLSDGTVRQAGLSEEGFAAQQAGLQAEAAAAANRRSAKASLESWLATFFDPTKDADTIRQMMAFVNQQIETDVPVEAIELKIREQPFYQQRFKGNEGLRAAGLAEMSPAEYLAAERQYSELLAQANLGNLARRDVFSSLIGGQVSAVELQDRVVNVYDRIKNADQALKDEMQRLNQLGNITAADYAESLLLGKEGAASLKRKIAQAEISTEFTGRGIQSALGVGELERLGVTRQQAAAGAEYAKTGTQRLQDLAAIYGAQPTDIQTELEKEAFTGLASQRRKQLTGQERAAFAGGAGTGTPSLGRSTLGAI